MSALDGIFHIAGSVNNLKPFLTSTTNGAFPPLILRRRDDRRVVERLRWRLGANACPQRPHIFFRMMWPRDNCFYILFSVLRRPGTSPTAAAAATAPSSTWGSWAGRAGGRAAHRRSSTLFVDGGDGISVRDVADASTSSPFLSIFIEQIQSSP